MKNNIISWVGSVVTLICAGLTTSEAMQIALYALGIISALVSLAFNIYVWYKKAKADGVITKEELEELDDIVTKGIKDIKDKEEK